MNNDEGDPEETSSRLADGLKSCRTVVSTYRALLKGDVGAEQEGEEMASSPDTPETLVVADPAED